MSEATLANGCLHVVPGSHALPVQHHGPDRRESANYGYVEIPDVDEAASVPVLMEPGDLLLFDSHLIHRSTDNVADAPRSHSTTSRSRPCFAAQNDSATALSKHVATRPTEGRSWWRWQKSR